MPSPCVVSGNLQQMSSGLIAQGQVIFELANVGVGNPAMITGTSLFPNWKYTIYSAPDGSFIQNIWGNDNINPSNTIYNVTFRDIFGNEMGPIQYSITGSTADLNNITAVINTIPPVIIPSGGGPTVFTVLAKSADFTAVVNTFFRVSTGAGVINSTLPAAAGITGQEFEIKKVDSGAGSVQIAGTIDGASGYTLTNQDQYVRLMSNGADFDITANN